MYGVLERNKKGEAKRIHILVFMPLWCSKKILHPPLLVVLHDAEGKVEWGTVNFSSWRN